MNRDVQKVAERHGQIVVERDSELRHFDEWLAQRNPRTVVCSVSGIGGIGKTTFLGQIADHACRAGVRTTHVDGYLGFSSAIELLSYLCEQHQCQPAGTDTGASTGAKRDEGFLSEVISLLSGRLGEHRTILLFDHFEEMLSIESFIRTQLIPGLPLDGVMLVFASRRGLSIGWRTDPTLITRTIRITLGNLSWHQSLDYVKRAGIENVDVQQQISRETSGYPLSLALAVQSVLSGNEDEEDAGYSINEISAGLIREVAPDLNPLLDGLMFLRTSTQNVLSRLLQKPVSSQEYRALGQLSFVRVTSKGLAIHDVARAYLLSDLKIRLTPYFIAPYGFLETSLNGRQGVSPTTRRTISSHCACTRSPYLRFQMYLSRCIFQLGHYQSVSLWWRVTWLSCITWLIRGSSVG
ncbi:ATP-binding protein [Alicyclobacillus curvatus]|nr:ATP-binding protein [Alicyclobacillus curvatus]